MNPAPVEADKDNFEFDDKWPVCADETTIILPHKPDCRKSIKNNGVIVALSCTCYPMTLEEL